MSKKSKPAKEYVPDELEQKVAEISQAYQRELAKHVNSLAEKSGRAYDVIIHLVPINKEKNNGSK